MKYEEFRIVETPAGFKLQRKVNNVEITKVGPWWNRKEIRTNKLEWEYCSDTGSAQGREIRGRAGFMYVTTIPPKVYKTIEEVKAIINHLCAKEYPVYYYPSSYEPQPPEFPADRIG